MAAVLHRAAAAGGGGGGGGGGGDAKKAVAEAQVRAAIDAKLKDSGERER
jgi:hypothetical protein